MNLLLLLLVFVPESSLLPIAHTQRPSSPRACPLRLRGGAWLFEPKVATLNKGYHSIIRWTKAGKKPSKGEEEEGGEVPPCSEGSQEPQRVCGVERTNDDSTMSKGSACRQGYLDDVFLKRNLFQPRLCRRTALINRGYFVRMELVRTLLSSFVDMAAESQVRCQVLVLGAGYDTSYLHLKGKQRLDHVRWLEVDLPAVVRRKSDMLRQDLLACSVAMCEDLGKVGEDNRMLRYRVEQLQELYAKHPHLVRQDLGEEGTLFRTSDLCLLGGDLRELEDLDRSLERSGFCQFLAPTLVLAECVLQYLEEEEVRRLLRWLRVRFPNAVLVSYDQTNPFDLFGQVMTSSLSRKEQALKAISSCPDAAALRRRLLETGWVQAEALPLSYLYAGYLDRELVEEGERREKFDEEEEWREKCKHYSLSWAITDARSMSQLVQKFPRWNVSRAGEEGEDVGKTTAPPVQGALIRASCIRACDEAGGGGGGGGGAAAAGGFWGHASVKIGNDLWIFGGHTSGGVRSNQLLRASLPAPPQPDEMDDGRQICVEIVSGLKGAPSPRVWHAACAVFDRYLVVHGGRSSPPNPVQKQHGTQQQQQPQQQQPQQQQQQQQPQQQQQQQQQESSVFSDVAVLDTQRREWRRVLCAGNAPPPMFRHKAGVLRTENDKVEIMLLLGGLEAHGTDAPPPTALVCKTGEGKEELQLSWCEVNWSGSFPSSCAVGRSVTAADNSLLLFGGYDPNTRLLSDSLHRVTLLGVDMGRRIVRLASEELRTSGTRPCGRFAHAACLLSLPGGGDEWRFLLIGGGSTDREEAQEESFPLHALDLDRLSWQELEEPRDSWTSKLCSIKTDMWAGATWRSRSEGKEGKEARTTGREKGEGEGEEEEARSDVYIVGGGMTCFSFGSHFNAPFSTFRVTAGQAGRG